MAGCSQITNKKDFEPLSISEALLNLNPETELYSIDELCRFCMNAPKCSDKCVELFLDDESSKEIRRICQSIFPKKIEISDGLPHKTCETCVNDLKTCMRIMEKIKEADRYLRAITKYSLFIDDDEDLMRSDNEVTASSSDESVRHVSKKALLVPFGNFKPNSESDRYIHNIHNQEDEILKFQNVEIMDQKMQSLIETAQTMNSLEMVCSNVVVLPSDSSKNLTNSTQTPIEDQNQQESIDLLNFFDVARTLEVELNSEDHVKNAGLNENDAGVKVAYKCLECFKVQSSYQDLVEHVLVTHRKKPTPDKFVCSFCLKEFADSDSLVDHAMAEHPTDKVMKCPRCDHGGFSNKRDLDAHTNQEHNFPCNICDKIFRSKERLERHFYAKHETCTDCSVCGKQLKNVAARKVHEATHDTDTAQVCWICGVVLKYKSSLRSHMITHEEGGCNCPVCDKAFITKYALNKHLRRYHGAEGHTCDVCSKGFNSRELLKCHMRVHKEKPYKCDFCSRAFRKRESVDRHEAVRLKKGGVCPVGNKDQSQGASKLKGTATYECDVCGRKFYKVRNKTRHRELHFCTGGDREIVEKLLAQPEVHQCGVCDVYLFTKIALQKHVAQHTGAKKPYSCEFCGKSFLQAGSFRIHERVHTGERPFICKYCDKAFICTTNLLNHVKTHTTQTYTCTLCGKHFKDSELLQRHIGIHQDPMSAKPYPCYHCGKRFTTSERLSRHISSVVHSDKPSSAKTKHVQDEFAPTFPCEVCGRIFMSNASRRRHVSRKHQENVQIETIPESFVEEEMIVGDEIIVNEEVIVPDNSSMYMVEVEQACKSVQLDMSPLSYFLSRPSNYQV